MKFKKLEKGMTLVEIIVATALFAITCATLFTAILFALKNNKQNYYAGEEIQMQMNSAENYDENKTLFDNKVAKYRINGSNNVELKVDFATDTNGYARSNPFYFSNDEVYAYQANARYKDSTANYNMRFFQAKSNVAYDPSSKKFWVRFHNYSSTDLSMDVYSNEADGVSLIDDQGNYAGKHFVHKNIADDTGKVSLQFGLSLASFTGTGGIFFYGDWLNDYYNNPSYTMVPGKDFELTASNLDYYCIKDENGDLTGEIEIYYDGNDYYNKADMAAMYPEYSIG
ncbi:MAG: type II secretion system protein [Ruminococcus sp.]|nr:type II secretion system protein [Ruminococcus sp.]MBR1753151.1 type II secretion system protein [Ruminococcus sp.]